jgi:hypothetical protein
MKVATFFSAGASVAVAAGASVGLVGGSVAAGSSGPSVAVAGCPPQAARTRLASTASESRMFKLRFMFLLRENVIENQQIVDPKSKMFWRGTSFDRQMSFLTLSVRSQNGVRILFEIYIVMLCFMSHPALNDYTDLQLL